MTLTLASTAFAHAGRIPKKYTCDGENVSPPLTISGVPKGTVSLALTMEDPDIPQFAKEKFGIDVFDHWTLFTIPPSTTEIAEDASSVGKEGVTTSGKTGYTGPCPPPDHEPKEHRYFFRLYALDAELSLVDGVTKDRVLAAIKGHVLATTELMGTYTRAV
ncbi:MAG: hypothetical protein B7X04_02285 [Parcubacteria group bacterium 21-54-25]|nr:MAG: hypothetical protein B7X04_02285 [Parcubacteria group bacterium 21-54-25]HQU07876.1 YbhB/YbcL family Raf kinase inhibitor-like protein [Candidatus Paceibacterota bacterium]